MQLFSKTGLILAALTATLASGARAQSQSPLFFDDFSGSSLDAGRWTSYDGSRFLHNTQFGGSPTFGADADGTKWMRVPLQTFNPNPGQGGKTSLGTQVFTRQAWGLGAGVEFEARMRAKDLPPGLVLGFFAYGASGKYPDTYQQTEIDFELLTKQNGDAIWTNIWANNNPLRGGGGPSSSLATMPGLNWHDGAWHVFKIRWLPGRTQWLVDGRILREETTVLPGSPMAVRFNHWMANSSWVPAYGARPAANAQLNRDLGFDVDYLKVSRLAPPATGFWGNGTGLTARYFKTPDLSGPAVVRRDPRLFFSWGPYAPSDGIGNENWTARWTGFLQAQYSEKYTIFLASDDGARLWLGSNLLIDDWDGTGLSEKSVSVDLQAGEKLPLRIEYRQSVANATIRIGWSSASTPRVIVPQSQLYPEVEVATPIFSPPGGFYSASQNVAIASSPVGAVVRYTLDGSEPTEKSLVFRAGAKLSVKSSQLIRARAFLTNQAPSEESAAFYAISTSNRPTASVDSPAANSFLSSIVSASGTATRGASNSPITRVTFRLRRLSDNLRWNGTAWIATEYGLATRISPSPTDANSVVWTSNATFPGGANLPQSIYELKSVAVDALGNVGIGTIKFSVDWTPPLATISFPRNGATVPDMWGIAGTVRDNLGSANISRVTVGITRADGAIWDGWGWKNQQTAIPTALNGENWSVVVPASNGARLPWAGDLPDGNYEIRVVAFDNARNASATSIAVVKRAPSAASGSSANAN